jgi:hypothetical protein
MAVALDVLGDRGNPTLTRMAEAYVCTISIGVIDLYNGLLKRTFAAAAVAEV